MRVPRALILSTFFLACVVAFTASLFARSTPAKRDASADPVVHTNDPNNMRIEGEKRFHANCGRCHAAPQKYPPRMMATVLRHMRVRALLTDEDEHLILFYMTQ
jgi:cytochrome c5